MLVTHDTAVAARAQRIGLMRDGLLTVFPGRGAAAGLAPSGRGGPVRATSRDVVAPRPGTDADQHDPD